MPYDPVRDTDVAPSPSAAPSPARAPSQSPAPSPHLASRLPRHLTTPLSDRTAASTSGGRLDYPPAFSDSGARYSSSTQVRQSPLESGHHSSTLHTPHTPGLVNTSSDTRAPGYFDIQTGTPAPSRMSSGMRGGLGDLLNGPSVGSEPIGYGRPRSSSSALGVGSSATPGGESMSRSSSTSGGAHAEHGGIPGSASRSMQPGSEKRGNSLSMLLNDGPSTATTPSLALSRDPASTPNHIPHFNRSPAFGQGRLPETLSPGTAFTQPPNLQHLPHRDHPSPGSIGPLHTQPIEPHHQLDPNPSRVGWINSFGQGRPSGEDVPSERPFNPAQRLISPNRMSSPRASVVAESEAGPVEGHHERRKSTVVGWSGGTVAELGAQLGGRNSMDEGRGSIGGSSGRSRVSISSVQGYDPQHAPGSPFGQGVARIPERRSSENSGVLGGRLAMQPTLEVRPIDTFTMPAFVTAGPIPHPHVDLTSPIPLPNAVLDGFTSVAPPPKQRKKSKRDIAKEAKEALANASAAEDSEAAAIGENGRASPSVKPDGESASLTTVPDPALLAPAKPKTAGKRKASGTSATGDGPAVKPRARGRPRKDSTMVVDEPMPDVEAPQLTEQKVVVKVENMPTRLAYNPTNRVSPITSLLVPLTPSEAAFLQDPRNSKNPLKQAWLAAQAGKTAVKDEPMSGIIADGQEEINGTGQKRPRDAEDEHMGNGDHPGEDYVKRARQKSPPQPHKNPASHYNARRNIGKDEREESKIVGLKKFNNWVKSVTIKKFGQRRPGTRAEPLTKGRFPRYKPNGRVLDIGCGKGGDLAKWDKADIEELVGIDVASKSIEDYKDRLRSLNRPLCYETHLHVLDCFSAPLTDVLSKAQLEPLFDNVVSQFCIHYAFQSVRNVRMMLENVSRYLRPGGIFFGTTVSSTKLLNYLAQVPEDAEELTIGNEYFKITFEEREHKGAFGHAYSFFLEDAIDDCVEYLIDWEEFVEIAKEYKLECVYREDFDTFYEQEKQVPEYGQMAERMGVSEGGVMFMDADQWEAATIYLAFAFQRLE